MALDSFSSQSVLRSGERHYRIRRLSALSEIADIDRLPYSIKILLENLLRHEDGVAVTAEDISTLARWPRHDQMLGEIAFTPERVLMQDFTGIPAIVDLAVLRDALSELGGDPRLVNPRVPVELIVDHSVIAEYSGSPDAFSLNALIELQRNKERYRLLRWAQKAFTNFAVVPPDTGICHQINLEYLARVVFATEDGEAFPDTLVGTDSHTPMVNGLGVLGWGVGGIEAEAAMLGHPQQIPIPAVVGVELSGELTRMVTATDLVLTIAELLRQYGVVGKFVEFTGPGLANLRVEHRATLGNMSPEYGATCAICPIDETTLGYLRLTGRSEEHIELVERYAKEQGLFHDPEAEIARYSQLVTLDLSSVEPSIAGPSRPQDRIALSKSRRAFRASLAHLEPKSVPKLSKTEIREPLVAVDPFDEVSAESFPASDPPSAMAGLGEAREPIPLDSMPRQAESDLAESNRVERPTRTVVAGEEVFIDDGHIVIAAITSCTNTSNPQVMVAAGLLAKKAVELGLRSKPWVKTSLAPGSRVVTDYLDRAGLSEPLAELGFDLVGYGCTTCIGNSGPLLPGVAEAVREGRLAGCAILSGNRNFEGRIHPDVRMNYLCSPPLVVAYALAGTMDIDLSRDPLGFRESGEPVLLSDLWPTSQDIDRLVSEVLDRNEFTSSYAKLYEGNAEWAALDVGAGIRFPWKQDSVYIRRAPFLNGVRSEIGEVSDIGGARALAVLGDSVTTDHISPAGQISALGVAGKYLVDHGVEPKDFNSFGARRGNHEVMVRGTFANIRLKNALVPGVEGGITRYLPGSEQLSIFDAAMRYKAEKVPLIILAGKEYGSGSSRDWAAKGTMLLGVRAVIAESYERIHRSNLVGMGVLPLQFAPGNSAVTLGLSGEESFDIIGLRDLFAGSGMGIKVLADGREIPVVIRLDTQTEYEYYRHGGVLPFVLRELVSQ